MALRFAYLILPFYLLLLMCDHGNGARDVAKQDWKQVEVIEQNEVSHKTARDAKESDYITEYGTKQDAEKTGYAAGYGTKQDGYAAAYNTKQDAKDSGYEAAYGTKQDLEESGYAAAYRTKQDAKESYITAYGTKEDVKDAGMEHNEHRNHANGVKDVDEHHLKKEQVAYQKEMNQPYITGYRSRQANYISSYGTRQDEEDNYTSAYGTKEDLKDSGVKHNNHRNHANGVKDVDEQHLKQVEVAYQKEMNEPYKAGYRNRQYMAGYRTRQDAKDNYITAYTRQDAKDNYITAYGTKEALKDSGMQYKEHCGQIDGVKDEADQHLKQVEVAKEKEMNQPYIAGYRNRQANYITSYVTSQDAKDNYITAYTRKSQNSYAASYRNTQDEKESDYITAYGDGKDSKASGMVHENHMAAKPSSHMDHSEAFKSGFFTIDDLYVRKIMPLRFPIQEFSHFLPREEADSIPFSRPQLPNVLQLFSIPLGSPNAKAMEDTLQQCESLPIKGEIKLCATSLESMLDFVRNIMGSWTNLNVLTTTHPTMATVLTQNYSVLRISDEIYAPKWVACHPLSYPYKVFYCHFIERSKVFKVSLRGDNGQKVEAVAVCHMDTSDWDPDHILFRQLGIKPGASSPICHFLPVYHLVWVPSPTPATASI